MCPLNLRHLPKLGRSPKPGIPQTWVSPKSQGDPTNPVAAGSSTCTPCFHHLVSRWLWGSPPKQAVTAPHSHLPQLTPKPLLPEVEDEDDDEDSEDALNEFDFLGSGENGARRRTGEGVELGE